MSGADPLADLAQGKAPRATVPSDVYEFVIHAQDTACLVQMVNVFHLLAITPNCTALQIVNDWRVNLESLWVGLFASSIRVQRYEAFNLVPFNTDSYSQTVDVPGSRGVITEPPLVAAIITWRTGQRGRRHRGRTYVGGICTPDVTNGRLNSAAIQANWKAFADGIMARWGAGGTNPDMRFGVWSRVIAGPSPPYDKLALTTISSYTIQDRLGSMGTRRVGRGP